MFEFHFFLKLLFSDLFSAKNINGSIFHSVTTEKLELSENLSIAPLERYLPEKSVLKNFTNGKNTSNGKTYQGT